VCPFVQAQLAMVHTQIRIWPNEPWFCDLVVEGRWNQGLGKSLKQKENRNRLPILVGL